MQHPLEAFLIDTIHQEGPIPFDRFMEAALYHPDWGYYESEATQIGRAGDFQTSVSVGPFFGELLAWQFLAWNEDEPHCQWLECGAHHGQLAEDVLGALQQIGASSKSKVRYVIMEPSPARRKIQQERLAAFEDQVVWVEDWPQVKQYFSSGVIFSNELLDAFPVKRLIWDKANGCWRECLVDVSSDTGGFAWITSESEAQWNLPWLPKTSQKQIEAVLPDQYIIEWSPSAQSWWREAARHLDQGHLVTIDYGFTDMDQFAPHRTHGTLRTYNKHRVGDALLSKVGRQDLTAHVDFPSLQKIGEEAGLSTQALQTQESFMHRCFESGINQGLEANPEKLAQFRTLMHPEHFGRSFKVLIQRKQQEGT